MKTPTLVLLLIFSFSAVADQIRSRRDGDAVAYATLTQDGIHHLFLLTREQKGKLPRLIERRTYADLKAAERDFAQRTKNWHEVTGTSLDLALESRGGIALARHAAVVASLGTTLQ